MQGIGEWKNTVGDYYVGNWENSKMHGWGKY